MKWKFGTALIILLSCFTFAHVGANDESAKDEMNSISVIDLDCGKFLTRKTCVAMTDVVIGALVKIKKYDVVDRARRDKKLKKRNCRGSDCAVNAGRKLGVGKIVVGSIIKLGETYMVNLHLVNVETALVENAVNKRCDKCKTDDLTDTVAEATRKLAGVSPQPEPKAATPDTSSIEPAKQKYVDAKGMAAIVNKDVVAARDRALVDARRRAVETVVGTLLSWEIAVEKFPILNDNIFSKSESYICGETITDESEGKYNYYVALNACVKVDEIKADLRDIRESLRTIHYPNTLLMITEQHDGRQVCGWWKESDLSLLERELIDEFREKGFPLIDSDSALGDFGEVETVEGEVVPSEAQRLGKWYSAEYVVIGKSVMSCKLEEPLNMYKCHAEVKIRIVEVDTGRVFGAASSKAQYVHPEDHEARVRAVNKAALQIAPEIIASLTPIVEIRHGSKSIYKVLLTNVTSFPALDKFKSALENVTGVGKISYRKYSKGEAELKVQYKGLAEDLAKEMEDKTGAEVTDFTDDTIKVRLK